MKLRGFLAMLLALTSSAGYGNTSESQFTDIESLRSEVQGFATGYFNNLYRTQAEKGDVRVTVSSLDSRLQLRKCDQPIHFTVNAPAHRSSKITVKTACKGENRWTIYVPVTADVYENVVVAAHSLERGAILGEKDLRRQRANINRFGEDYLVTPDRLVGMELQRSLGAGETLKLSYVKPADVITRGDTVILESSNTAVTIQVSGTALEYGHIGERIRVRNDQSERVVDAMVVGPGRVSVVSR